MKNIVAIGLFLCFVNASAMQLVKKVQNWRDERASDSFIDDFGSKPFVQARVEMNAASLGMQEKIFQKIKDQKRDELFSGSVILAALSVELQKKILEEVDIAFVDQETARVFLHKPISQALRWHAVISKKMGANTSCVFKERKLFGKNFSCELTKEQLLKLSSDEMIILKDLRDEWKALEEKQKIFIGVKKEFNEKELIILDQLIRKKYIVPSADCERLVSVKIPRKNMVLKTIKDLVFIALPLYLIGKNICLMDNPKNATIRSTNKVLEEREVLGEGPFLKHQLYSEVPTPDSLYQYMWEETKINEIYFIIKALILRKYTISSFVNQYDPSDCVVLSRSIGYYSALMFLNCNPDVAVSLFI